MTKKQVLVLLLLNLLIALGFFFENYGAGFGQLSSDLHNSIPVCYKFDDPSLFQKDLYLNQLDNVRYYTPFYIQSIRFFAWMCGGDYLLGINIFATLIHLIFGIGWFLLFRKVFGNFAIALFLSVLIRGIVWLPGLEIWGISDLWTMMPRTLYAAFMPIPFLLLLYKNRFSFFAASFVIALIFNFHPITGLGGLWLFVSSVILYAVFWKVKLPLRDIGIAVALIVLGMLPFIATYFTQTDTKAVYDLAEYKRAFFTRIPTFFEEPAAFLQIWLRGSSLFFFGPLLLFMTYSFYDRKYLKPALLLAILSLTTIFVFTMSVYVENAVNAAMGSNLRMAFQLIRAQKLAVLPGYFAIGYLVLIAFEKVNNAKIVFKFAVPVFVIALAFAKAPAFDNVPFFKDDIARSIFPDWKYVFAPASQKISPLEHMLDYIKLNTPKDALFYGAFVIRSACQRSVTLDGKGASMLIEGNPVAFIQWYRDTRQLRACVNDTQKIAFLKSKSVDYIYSGKPIVGAVKLVHREDGCYLYKID